MTSITPFRALGGRPADFARILAGRDPRTGGRGIADAALDRGRHYEEHRTGTINDLKTAAA